MIDHDDPQWYRDAIIYQLHVKSFFDANNDGIGDFGGLTQKLDYIKDLGATAIWVMPFYPSPLRDDGYDVSSYRGINPAYGSLRDFKRFVRKAHERGLRVITELVINHTSDKHPWFQRARAAKPSSAARNFYIWANNDRGYKDARIIFLDTEKSNWTWDDQAKAYFWHRFYAHQPDLNFDNPRVLEAVLDVMASWLDMGVDGLRLDAVPYLIEREGTNCENLPETHAVIKKIRAAIDARYFGRMLLAEANQWPEDAAQYFGQGDECHMAFHFPLMPRIYMALAQEDRHPITDIMRQTPEIPDGAQWAIFLRNHDEMTLEMVTAKERDYLWTFYAADPRARLNLGIRRRLAPLLENDRRKIELLNSLLFSMPGTPILYYGDEIGMGDNIYLGDRDGVRTPMQWSLDRNGGFSRAEPAKLFLPAIQDPVYGFSAVNVEAQLASPSSLLTWMRRMIAGRRSHPSLGRGTLRFLYPANRKVLAYLREFQGDRILCVANVSRAPQAVELDLSEFNGVLPVELTAGTVFPRIGTLTYLLTLPAYGFFWFRLETAVAKKDDAGLRLAPELFTLVVTGNLESVLAGSELAAFERAAAPQFLAARRWFAGKSTPIKSVAVRDFTVLRDGGEGRFILPLIDVSSARGQTETYFMPMAAVQERDSLPPASAIIAKLRRAALHGVLYDAAASPGFGTTTLAALRRGETLQTNQGGRIVFSPLPALASEPMIEAADVKTASAEQSNSSIILANRMILKLYRRLYPGTHPEAEMCRFLTEAAHFTNSPPLLGVIEHTGADATRTTLGILQSFVNNQGDAWTWTRQALKRALEAAALSPAPDNPVAWEGFSIFVPHMQRLGARTAGMHKALAIPTQDSAFKAEPLTLTDVREVAEEARKMAESAFAYQIGQAAGAAAQQLLARKQECFRLIGRLTAEPQGAIKIRVHGDYHLGQVLVVEDDVMIVDFEGEPSRPPEERRKKASPMRDVAGMLRSFSYALAAAKRDLAPISPDAANLNPHLVEFSQIFIRAYMKEAHGSPIWIEDRATQKNLLMLHLLAKALYEIDYEAGNRPDWIDIPIEGVIAILDHMAIDS